MRASAATDALDHEADIARVEEWLNHANIATTRIYDRRKTWPEDSPTFRCGTEYQGTFAAPPSIPERPGWREGTGCVTRLSGPSLMRTTPLILLAFSG